MTRWITGSYKKFICNKINYKFVEKIYKCNNQLQILARDQGIDRLNGVFVD